LDDTFIKKQIFYLRYFLHPVPVNKNMNTDLKLKK